MNYIKDILLSKVQNSPSKRGIKVKFPFLEGVDAAFYAADGVVIL
jgi:hypothetical protein